jgi:hypothetical protein
MLSDGDTTMSHMWRGQGIEPVSMFERRVTIQMENSILLLIARNVANQ